jgi:hypothetical protein
VRLLLPVSKQPRDCAQAGRPIPIHEPPPPSASYDENTSVNGGGPIPQELNWPMTTVDNTGIAPRVQRTEAVPQLASFEALIGPRGHHALGATSRGRGARKCVE